jgi:CRISPR system Cascade subunit CasD
LTMKHLGFRCYGPLASWGDVAVGEHRPTYAVPSRSALVGLIAGALGIARDREEDLRRLSDGVGVAARVDASGTPCKDYHTAQVPPRKRAPEGGRFRTRRDEILAGELQTVLSSRDSVADAVCTVVVWARVSAAPSLDDLCEALRRPVFTPYLGRKSNPPALPLHPQVVEADGLCEAFERLRFDDETFLVGIPRDEVPYVYWDEDYFAHGFDELHLQTRRDLLLSSRRRQFAERRELRGVSRVAGAVAALPEQGMA